VKIKSIISVCLITIGIINADNAPVIININSNNTEAKPLRIGFINMLDVEPGFKPADNSPILELRELGQLNKSNSYRYYDAKQAYIERLERAIRNIAQDRFDIILKSGVMYISAKYNITPEIIELLNKEYLAQ
jgi:hypothetical protein